MTTRYAEFAHIFTAIVEGKPLERLQGNAGQWVTLTPMGIDNLLSDIAQGSVPSSHVRTLPVMLKVGSHFVPRPESFDVEHGVDYYVPSLRDDTMPFERFKWVGSLFDSDRLARGLVHLTATNAATHARALFATKLGLTNYQMGEACAVAPVSKEAARKIEETQRMIAWLQASKNIDGPATSDLVKACVKSGKLSSATEEEMDRLATIHRFMFAVHKVVQG